MKRIGGRYLGTTLLLALVTCVAEGCGSHDAGTSVCQQPPASASDPHTAAALSAAQGHHDLEGTWLNGRQASILEIDFAVGETLPGSGTGCWGSLLLATDAHVKTRDGVLDGRGSVVRFENPVIAVLEVPLPELADAYARPDPAVPPIAEGPASFPIYPGRASNPEPTLLLSFSASGLAADVVVDRNRVVGRWNSDAVFVPPR